MERNVFVFFVLFPKTERTEARQQRLGNESMRNFDACALCLQRARDPIACEHGHLFCKECAFADLRMLSSIPSARLGLRHPQ